MAKKIFKILGIIAAGAGALIIVLWAGYYGYGYYMRYKIMHDLKEPYVQDAKESLGGETPMDAYHKFREALKNNNTAQALQYIFVNSREKYAEELKDTERIKIYLDMPEELKEQYTSECSGEAFACQESAVYYYEYEATGEKKEYDLGNGYVGVHEPGIYTSELIFIKNLAGKWQIDEL